MASEGASGEVPTSVRFSLRLVTAAGCLAMVFVTGVMNPGFTEFFRELGANEFHFGVLAGIPLVCLSMQFVGAWFNNRISNRKSLFMATLISARVLHMAVIVVPLFIIHDIRLAMPVVFVVLAVGASLSHIGGPAWFSWMADMVPRRVFNTYWGVRQRWMFLTWTTGFLAVAAFMGGTGLPASLAYPAVAAIGVTAGVIDILLFVHVHEPDNTLIRGRNTLDILLEPFRHREFRTFVWFSAGWQSAAIMGAAFMQLYVLEVLGVPMWQATLMWSTLGLGTALASKPFGRLADRFGHRPILTLCVSLKSFIVVVFLLVTPGSAVWVLPVAFFFDSMLNAGLLVASNGYMLRIAPQENRSMFIAAITGFAGICGGLSAVLAGVFMKATDTVSVAWLGRSWINYHFIFAASAALRLGCIFLALRIREPASHAPRTVLGHIMGAWPLRFIKFPVGLYRNAWGTARRAGH